MGVVSDSFFAPAARATPDEIAQDMACVVGNPLVDALLQAAGGLMAVLNQNRQVLAVNHALLCMLGIEDPEGLVGLRPGEVVGCDHAAEPPAGCGTTRYCTTCGAAISIVGALSTESDTERKCVLNVVRNGTSMDLCLRVRARILTLQARRFVLLFLQDVTTQERMSEVQRTFLHDLRNLLQGLSGSAELLGVSDDAQRDDLIANISKFSNRITAEVNLQQKLAGDARGASLGARRPLKVAEVMADTTSLVHNHATAKGKHLVAAPPAEPWSVVSDAVLLGRVLLNMLINAFEATPADGEVRLWSERQSHGATTVVRFLVWNAAVIPPEIQLRIFQRHFSTKSTWGRGVGTWSMKLLGEHFLQGKVGFTSEPGQGTTFYLELPEAKEV